MYEVTGEVQRYLKEELEAEYLARPNPHVV